VDHLVGDHQKSANYDPIYRLQTGMRLGEVFVQRTRADNGGGGTGPEELCHFDDRIDNRRTLNKNDDGDTGRKTQGLNDVLLPRNST
jgi:hypothetical protein